jgi:Transposase DDE domain
MVWNGPVPHDSAFYDWKTRVDTRFDALKPHHRVTLAQYTFGMILARCCGLTAVVTHLVALLAIKAHALRARLRELYQPASAQLGSARTEFDYTLCFAPLIRWAAGTHTDKRLVLALDPTNLTDRFRVLCVAVLYHGCGLPVAWAVQAAHEKGSWNAVWFDLLGKLKAALGDGWTVLVLTDRGLESPELFREIVRLGWHPLMRVKKCGHFRPATWHKGYPMDHFASRVKARWSGEGVAYPTGERLECTLLACREVGHDEPWLILTDLPASGANPAWYAWRMWIEHGFRALKRGCWQWHKTQMREPVRVARLWAVIAVATIYTVEVGGEAQPANLPPVRGPLSRLKRGLLRVWVALLTHGPMPRGTIRHHDWPEPTTTFDILLEPYVHEG